MAARSIAQTLRQHHGIEHGTMTLLSRRLPGTRLIAHSNLDGFTLLGAVETDVVRATAEEALMRLQRGEAGLAVHPNCGTNLVTAGALTGLGALLMTQGRGRSWWDRIPSAILGATLALIVAPPAGQWVQTNLTTSADVAGLRIISVTKLANTPIVRHQVTIGEQGVELAAR